MPGFALADCVPVRGDGVARPVRRQGARELKELAGQSGRARFRLSDAALYSFGLGEEHLPSHNTARESLAEHIRKDDRIPVFPWYSDPLPTAPELTADGWSW